MELDAPYERHESINFFIHLGASLISPQLMERAKRVNISCMGELILAATKIFDSTAARISSDI